MDEEALSRTFKIFALSWSMGIAAIMMNYTINVGLKIGAWGIFMLVQQLLSWVTITIYSCYLIFIDQAYSEVLTMKIVFLIINGPFLLGLSFYAFYLRENLRASVYAVSFMIWWLLFGVSVYCCFKLTLEVSLILHRRRKKLRLKEHYRSIGLRSIK